MHLRYQSIHVNIMHNQYEHKGNDLKEKTRNIGGMHQGFPCLGKMLVFLKTLCLWTTQHHRLVPLGHLILALQKRDLANT
jgi:hypothetical protein